MQTHPVNYQMNHAMINFNHSHPNFSINTSQQTQPSHSSPIIFHHPTAQPPNGLQASNQQSTTQQRHTAELLEIVDQNFNSLNNVRFNQRNQLINGHLTEHCLSNGPYCGSTVPNSVAHSNAINATNANLLNALNSNSQANSTNYQRTQQQNNSSSRLLSSRGHRYNRNRWSRFLGYPTNSHLSSNLSNNHSIIHTNRPNTLVYSPTVQSPLSPLLNNLTSSAANNPALFAVQQQATPNVRTNNNTLPFINNSLMDSLYGSGENNCSNNSLTNLNNLNSLSNSNQITGQHANYLNRRFNNITNNTNRSRSRTNNNMGNNSNLNLNGINLLNTSSPFINSQGYNNSNVMPISNLHSNNSNYFINNNSSNVINEIQLMLAAVIQNNSQLQMIQNGGLQVLNHPIVYHNTGDLIHIINQLNGNAANTSNHFHQMPNHYSNQYFHHNNSSNPNTPSGSNGNGSNASALQEQNYEALLNLAHRLGEHKTRGLTKDEIDLLPSYKYRSSCSKSFKSKQQRTNSKLKHCKHHSLNSNNLKICLDNNNNLNLMNNSTHSEEELNDDFDELENDLAKKDKLLCKEDKLNGKRRCIRSSKTDLVNDEELDECCDNFICQNDPDYEDEKMICVICMCDFEIKQILRVLPCNHEYHARCIDKWLKANRSCPCCRACVVPKASCD